MDGPPRRYSGFAFPEGLFVLDEVTGEVTLVPRDGSAVRQLHGGPFAALPPPPLPAVMTVMTELDRDVIDSYPYPVAAVYARLFAESDPRQRCRLLVDTFATLLKLWALVLASDYLETPSVRDAGLNELLARDFQRPLISVWHLFSTRALSVFRGENRAPFAAELAAAYDVLETKCRTPFLARTQFEDAKGQLRTRESKLGKIQALIKYRNGLAHGYNLPIARAEQHLTTYLPVLREVLAEAAFMKRYPLYFAPDGGTEAYRLMGKAPAMAPESLNRTSQASSLFLLGVGGRELSLDGVALVDGSESPGAHVAGGARDLFLFEGNTRSAIVYASAVGEHVEKQHRIDRWRSLLEAKAIDVQLLRGDRLDLPTLRGAARRITSGTLQALVACGKFVPEVVFRPPAVREQLSQIELGDLRGVVFVGEGGSGKSTLAASVATEHLAGDDVVLFYRASSLLDADLQSRVVRDLGLRDLFFEDFLGVADPLFTGGIRLRIIVDGVNEHAGDVGALVGSIDAMVRQAMDHPWVRVVVTARTAAYERLPPSVRFGALEGALYLRSAHPKGPQPVVPLLPLTDDEVGYVYESYRAYRREDETLGSVHVFRPNTNYAELSAGGKSTLAMMRSPLMMRLLVVAFNGRDLGAELSSEEAMRLYFDSVVVGSADSAGPHWERAAFLKAFVAELDAASRDSLDRDWLYRVPALKRGLQTTQKDSVYEQLLDLGVLTELWDKERCLVRFGFDGLLEFLLAELHESSSRDPYGVLDLVRRSTSFNALGGALASNLVARCRAGDVSSFTQATRLIDALPDGAPERVGLMQVGKAMIERLAREGEGLQTTLTAMRVDATGIGVSTLLEAFDSLFLQGEVLATAAIIETALTIAEARIEHRVRALYAAGMLAQHCGRLDDALDAYRKVTDLARTSGDVVAAARAAVKQSEILRARDVEEALRLLDGAVHTLREAGALGDAAEARRQQAIIAKSKLDIGAAASLADDAVAMAESDGSANVRTQCFITRGIVAWQEGALEPASKWFERALRVAESEGQARNMALVAGNLGILARERGDFVTAVSYAKRQLDMSERISDRRTSASALHNMGVFAFEAGDVTAAASWLERGQSLLEELGDRTDVATSLVNQAALDIHLGRASSAVGNLARAIPLGEAHNEAALADALWLSASIAFDERDLGAAASFRDRLAACRPSPRREAQVGALDLRRSLAQGLPVAQAMAGFVPIEREFLDASPLPEVHELPIDVAVELAREAARSGDLPTAASVERVVRGWLRGRPHRYSDELARFASAADAVSA